MNKQESYSTSAPFALTIRTPGGPNKISLLLEFGYDAPTSRYFAVVTRRGQVWYTNLHSRYDSMSAYETSTGPAATFDDAWDFYAHEIASLLMRRGALTCFCHESGTYKFAQHTGRLAFIIRRLMAFHHRTRWLEKMEPRLEDQE